jgi:hypothetical protein
MPITHDVLHRLWVAYQQSMSINDWDLATYYWQALTLARAISGGKA